MHMSNVYFDLKVERLRREMSSTIDISQQGGKNTDELGNLHGKSINKNITRPPLSSLVVSHTHTYTHR